MQALMMSSWLICVVLVLLSIIGEDWVHADAGCSEKGIQWLWYGALQSNAVTFKLGVPEPSGCTHQTLIMQAFPRLGHQEKPHSSITACTTVPGTRHVRQCVFTDLPHANRTYDYQLVTSSPSDPPRTSLVLRQGSFRTPAVDGEAFNFRFAFSSCADEESDPRVFKSIREHDPLFFLHMGDLHYANLDVNDIKLFQDAYESLFAAPSGQSMLQMDLPVAYMWDDHDFGPDNSDKTAPGREASVQVYRQYVPHYDLVGNTEADPLGAIHQAFTIGRVRFILTDLRSNRAPNDAPDVPSKSALGVKQKKWLKEELVHATTDRSIGLIIWCSTMPWIDDERKWGHFKHEQRELVHFMQGHAMNTWTPILIVSGDAHMLAVDDGSHSPGNLTTFHAAALGKPGSIKGGPYSHGLIAGSGQYGLLDIDDDGKRICAHYRGIHVDNGVLLEYDTCHRERTPPKNPYYPPPVWIRVLKRRWKKLLRRPFSLTGIVIVLMLPLVIWQLHRHTMQTKHKQR